MAKVGFWLNGSQGKLAGATMYKDKSSGETIIREVVTPSNPKTERQTIQRIVMHTVANAYSFLKALCDHSFEGMSAGRDTMGYFIKNNIQLCRDAIARMQNQGVLFYEMYNFLPLGRRGFVANQYQIAMGSLPPVACSLEVDVADAYMLGVGAGDNTYEAVINKLGLQRGDQLTFLVIVENHGVKQLKYARVILDPTDPTTHLQAPLTTPFIVEGAINYPSVRNENEFGIRFAAPTAEGLEFGWGTEIVKACAVIVSRKSSDDTWMRSTTYLTYASGQDWSLGECIDYAQDGSTPVYTPSDYYLNNAGQGGGVAAATGADSGNSGQGGSANSPSVQSMSIGGSAAVVGTPKQITVQGSTPEAVTIVGNFNNCVGGQMQVQKVSDSTALGSAVTINEAGQASVSVTPAALNVTYKVVYRATAGSGDWVNTGFTFTEVQNTGGGSGEE